MPEAADDNGRDRIPDLLNAAIGARRHAYAPYSRFPVGAAVLSDTGHIFAGCNVENASFPVGICAEAGAVAAMIAAGPRRLSAILVIGGRDDTHLAPCGACRQRIAEFAIPGALVHMSGPGGGLRSATIESLLPAAFAGGDLRA